MSAKARPLCRWCGKPLRYWTQTIYLYERGRGWKPAPTSMSKHIGLDALPRSIAECRRLVNEQITKVHYNLPAGDPLRRVSQFDTWDGETYQPVAEFFCTNRCAMALGRAAARMPHNLAGPGYNKAMKARA